MDVNQVAVRSVSRHQVEGLTLLLQLLLRNLPAWSAQDVDRFVALCKMVRASSIAQFPEEAWRSAEQALIVFRQSAEMVHAELKEEFATVCKVCEDMAGAKGQEIVDALEAMGRDALRKHGGKVP